MNEKSVSRDSAERLRARRHRQSAKKLPQALRASPSLRGMASPEHQMEATLDGNTGTEAAECNDSVDVGSPHDSSGGSSPINSLPGSVRSNLAASAPSSGSGGGSSLAEDSGVSLSSVLTMSGYPASSGIGGGSAADRPRGAFAATRARPPSRLRARAVRQEAAWVRLC